MILVQFLFVIRQDKIIYGDEAVIRLKNKLCAFLSLKLPTIHRI